MSDILAIYWPYLVLALVVGIGVGWWYSDPRSADDLTAWLERGADEP